MWQDSCSFLKNLRVTGRRMRRISSWNWTTSCLQRWNTPPSWPALGWRCSLKPGQEYRALAPHQGLLLPAFQVCPMGGDGLELQQFHVCMPGSLTACHNVNRRPRVRAARNSNLADGTQDTLKQCLGLSGICAAFGHMVFVLVDITFSPLLSFGLQSSVKTQVQAFDGTTL